MVDGKMLSQLEQTNKIPAGSLHMLEMGDGSGTQVVTQETLVEEIGNDLKIGDMKKLKTENNESLVEAINEVMKSGGGSVDILETPEEIEANTAADKIAGALALKEMFSTLNDNLGGNNLYYNESEDAYYIQHGADSVPKKLQGRLSGTLVINFSYVVRVEYGNTAQNFEKNYGSNTVPGTITIKIKNGSIESSTFSGGTGASTGVNNSSGITFRGGVTSFKINSVKWNEE